ncbi:Uncharacterised protein [Brevibacterium casei]|uniref:Terminase small subunit n=1 Tax=Brevibacterium casei TaxID=33889 RepID=A0A449D7E1_9MICO|nr:hypothetical protein [Brevibacterium casei]VEW13549.1 Uncharacterised protein [Brevibacterium casei]
MTPLPAPEGLHERGSRLWSALASELDSAGREVLLEACRAADRLDELDRVIHGDGVIELMRFRTRNDEGDEVTVYFDNVLSEARQQQTTFQRLIQSLKLSSKPQEAGDFLDEIAARRESKATG